MDFELPGEDHPQRKAVRAWFEANPQASGRDLAEAGYVVPHWPQPWGLAADARAAAHHRRGDEAGRRRAAAQSGRHQQLRPVAADARQRGAAATLPAAGAVRRGTVVHAVQRAVGRLRSWRAAHRRPARRRSLCRQRPQDLDVARPQGEGRRAGRAHRARPAQAPGPVGIPDRHGQSRPHGAADHRHVGRRERIQRGLPRRGARAGRSPAGQGGRGLGAQHDAAPDRARGPLETRRDLGKWPLGARAGRRPVGDRRLVGRRAAR